MIEKFIAENIQRDITSYETVDDLYQRYLLFCRFYEIKSLTKTKFHNQIKYFAVGATDKRRRKGRESKVCRWGVKLLPCKY
ncbi:hypothetical protein [Heyndrickxia camelliae]|uniref:DNA primase/nucleoside triphosphatase C-terminal domain-containing protein n=1 Tax=Heyndrickxia camelliae TaxID=1707093 RepID=A0A2N3LDB7_9BACI|nr:hypothetical protein [Heyndrickxia camelliae]PKR82586.1 hypothetical protein CWO92_23675 [Heyndrickxia camelliae]